MLMPDNPRVDPTRFDRQQVPSGATDLANFGLAASGADMAASAGISLAFGVTASPATPLDLTLTGRATFTHSIDAPVLPAASGEHVLEAGAGLSVPSVVLPPAPDTHVDPTPVATSPSTSAPAAPAPQPAELHPHGSSTSPDILHQPTPAPSDAIETIRTTTAELAQAIESIAHLVTPAAAGGDAAIDATGNQLAAIAGTVAALGAAQADALAPLVEQAEQSVAASVTAVTNAAGEIVDQIPHLVDALGETASASVEPIAAIAGTALDTVGETIETTLAGVDPAGGLETLHDLLSGETAFELTDPANGAIVFSSVTAPAADVLEPVGDVVAPLGDNLGDVVGTALPLTDDHHEHGLGSALGGLFDHG